MNEPNANLSEEHSLRIFSHTEETGAALTVEEARVALEAVQRLNEKLEAENRELRERVELLDRLVVRLLKQNERLASKS